MCYSVGASLLRSYPKKGVEEQGLQGCIREEIPLVALL